VPKLLQGLKTWLQSMNDASALDVAVPETFEKRAEAPTPVEASSRLQSGAILGIFTLLVFYFLYFASPILIPIITALLLSMLLALLCAPTRVGSCAAHIEYPDCRGSSRRRIGLALRLACETRLRAG